MDIFFVSRLDYASKKSNWQADAKSCKRSCFFCIHYVRVCLCGGVVSSSLGPLWVLTLNALGKCAKYFSFRLNVSLLWSEALVKSSLALPGLVINREPVLERGIWGNSWWHCRLTNVNVLRDAEKMGPCRRSLWKPFCFWQTGRVF